MKKYMHLSLVTALAALFVFDSNAQNVLPDTTQRQIIKVNPNYAPGAKVSEIFQKVEFIPLETTKESLFGTITQLEILDDRFVIFDNDTRSILIFTTQGKFLKRIASSSLPRSGEVNDINEIRGFSIVQIESASYISILTKKGNLFYDKQGSMISVPSSNNNYSSPKYYVGNSGAFYQQSYQINRIDSIIYQLTLHNTNTTNYFPLNTLLASRDNMLSPGKSLTYDSKYKTLFYTTYYRYSIFEGTENGLLEKYKLVLPLENTLPNNFQDNPIYFGKKSAFLKSNPKIIFGIGNIYVIGQKLVVKMASFGGNTKNIFCIDLKNNTTISLNDLEPDASSYFLPVNDAGLGFDFANKAFLSEKDGWLYSSYSSMAMFKYIQLTTNKKQKYSKLLEEYFKTSDRKSNPIIVKAKLKND